MVLVGGGGIVVNMITGLLFVLLIGGVDFQKQLDIAGENRLEIEQAIREAPRKSKKWNGVVNYTHARRGPEDTHW